MLTNGLIAVVGLLALATNCHSSDKDAKHAKHVVAHGEQDFLALCNRKEIKLTKVSQIILLSEYALASNLNCDVTIRNAVIDLVPIVTKNIDDVCTQSKVDQVRQYYLKYIEKKKKNKLPSSLRKIFLSIGFQLSKLCKRIMVNTLISDTQEYLGNEPFKSMEKIINHKDFKKFSEPKNFDDLLLLSDLITASVGVKGNVQIEKENKFYIKIGTGYLMNGIRYLCQQRFKPIYDRLIMPIVALSKMGFTYNSKQLQKDFDSKKQDAEQMMFNWYRVTMVCEFLNQVEVVLDPKLGDDPMIRLISSSEAQQIKAEHGVGITLDTAEPIEQVVYESNSREVKFEDELLTPEMTKHIKKFSVNTSELDRVRRRFTAKLTTDLISKLKRGQFKTFAKLIANRFKKPADHIDKLDSIVTRITKPDMPVATEPINPWLWACAVLFGLIALALTIFMAASAG